MGDQYEEDILLWSERQSDLLRRIAAAEPVSERSDWGNIIEEVESVGRSDLRAERSLLAQALLHWPMAASWPDSSYGPSWQADARRLRAQARNAFSPSIRRPIDMFPLYADALDAVPTSSDGQPPRPVPSICPSTLDHLLEPDARP
jgi:hypothetical protein